MSPRSRSECLCADGGPEQWGPPAAASLIQQLEKGFEEVNKDIDLIIDINPKRDLYDLAPGGELSRLLGQGEGSAQVVEVDTLLLGALKDKGWVQDVGMSNPGGIDKAWQAATIGGTTYGIPTYLCSNVIYTLNPKIAEATDGLSLVRIFSAQGKVSPSPATRGTRAWAASTCGTPPSSSPPRPSSPLAPTPRARPPTATTIRW